MLISTILPNCMVKSIGYLSDYKMSFYIGGANNFVPNCIGCENRKLYDIQHKSTLIAKKHKTCGISPGSSSVGN